MIPVSDSKYFFKFNKYQILVLDKFSYYVDLALGVFDHSAPARKAKRQVVGSAWLGAVEGVPAEPFA